jgi:predicted transcriptional regulator YheO
MFEERQLEHVFALLSRVADAIAAVMPPTCDIAVLDLRTPGYAVVARHERSAGAGIGPLEALDVPPPEPILRNPSHDITTRVITPASGGTILSSIAWVRDYTGHVVGALSISCDYDDLAQAQALLQRLAPLALTSELAAHAAAVESVEEQIVQAIRDASEARRKPLHAFDREDRVAVMRALDDAGIFSLRRAVNIVARELAISRSSLYAYLREARDEPPAQPKARG